MKCLRVRSLQKSTVEAVLLHGPSAHLSPTAWMEPSILPKPKPNSHVLLHLLYVMLHVFPPDAAQIWRLLFSSSDFLGCRGFLLLFLGALPSGSVAEATWHMTISWKSGPQPVVPAPTSLDAPGKFDVHILNGHLGGSHLGSKNLTKSWSFFGLLLLQLLLDLTDVLNSAHRTTDPSYMWSSGPARASICTTSHKDVWNKHQVTAIASQSAPLIEMRIKPWIDYIHLESLQMFCFPDF